MREKILLIDDEKHVLDAYRRGLRGRYDLFFAESGADALSMVNEGGTFDAIVSDIGMPGMDGITLFSELLSRVPDTARVVVSGSSAQETVVDAVNTGQVHKYLTKPVSADDLADAIDHAMLLTRENMEKRRIEGATLAVTEARWTWQDLDAALMRDEFELWYQPKVDLETQNVIGFEALMRWQHPELGMVPPDEFIPSAEQNGFIVTLGAWAVSQACAQAALWWRCYGFDFPIAVNVSATQLETDDLVNTVKTALAGNDMPASLLELELTESLLITDSPRINQVLLTLSELGVNLTIDDFGTGYASFGYLKNSVFTGLKVDKSIVDGILENENDLMIFEAIATLAENLSLTLVAEGIETAEQHACLRKLGCRVGQGYLFDAPMPSGHIYAPANDAA